MDFKRVKLNGWKKLNQEFVWICHTGNELLEGNGLMEPATHETSGHCLLLCFCGLVLENLNLKYVAVGLWENYLTPLCLRFPIEQWV